jgi:hypothetical protein
MRSEVGAWTARRVPDLLDLTSRHDRVWQRPVALAAGMGAAALAVLLMLSAAVAIFGPALGPGGGEIAARLIAH